MKVKSFREINYDNKRGISQRFLVSEENSQITIIRYLTNDAQSVLLPDSIEGFPVTAIGEGCFFNHSEIKEIVLPNSLTRIGDQAFALCKGISELELPDQIEEIGIYAFRDCTGLIKVKLPAKLKWLRRGVFSFCYLSEHAEIILPEGLELIEGGAFWSGGCFELQIPDSVKEIGVGAFTFGPRVITKLPYDKGWYQMWPYGETISDGNGQSLCVSDVKEIPGSGGCLELTVEDGDAAKTVFYPFTDGKYAFLDENNQARMTADLSEIKDVAETHRAWKRGLL